MAAVGDGSEKEVTSEVKPSDRSTSEPLTREQHKLRAKLMGVYYSLMSHTYRPAAGKMWVGYIDADTLQELSFEECRARYSTAHHAGVNKAGFLIGGGD